MPRFASLALVVACCGAALALGSWRRDRDDGARCSRGFVAIGPRCEVPPGTCPPPLEAMGSGCDAPDSRVLVPSTEMTAGPSDWEAEGRIATRVLRVSAFRIDAFEATVGQWRRWTADAGTTAPRGTVAPTNATPEPSRAACGMTRAEAAAYCGRRGGRLPTEDEWIVAAASATSPPRRYPWGDTGAVCRRGAWGLRAGPCSLKGLGPDTVGAHGDGASPNGLYDMAGNVAEWVTAAAPDDTGKGAEDPSRGMAKGGSWQSALAADLRIWSRVELAADARDPSVGVRCVYPP